MTGSPSTVTIELLGSFRVTVDGEPIPAGAWKAKRACELVQLLALQPQPRLTRDQVMEALWPHLDPDAASANLRKAAHLARKALGAPDAVVLKGNQVFLFPSADVTVDAQRFEATGDPGLYRGDLLPDAPYEEWTQNPRAHLRRLYLEALRDAERWEELAEADPMDEEAHRRLMGAALDRGSRTAAIRWYGHLSRALGDELGIEPSAETRALYDACVEGLTAPEVLVGRDVELARATAVLRDENGPSILLVRGPAGIGKTALTHRFADLAEDEGWQSVRVDTTTGARVYGAVASIAAQLDPAPLSPEARAVIAAVTPGADATLAGPLGRHQVIGATRELLLTAGERVLLTVDDAHRLDEASIDVLIHLAERGRPGLVVLAYRPEPAPDPLVRGVARLARAGRADAVDLGPLDPDLAATLVGGSDPETARRIVTLAEGNPFAIIELARSASGSDPSLPVTVREAIIARFLHVPAETIAVLKRLALASDEFDTETVVALTGSSEEEAFAVLDQALDAGALTVSGSRYRFRHDLVRQALGDDVPPHQRLAVHRDAARRLQAAGAPPGQVAMHWLAGGRPEEAVTPTIAAAEEAMSLGAFSDSLRLIDRVSDHAAAHPRLLRLRAECLDALGDRRTLAAYDEAIGVTTPPETDDLRAKQALAQLKLGDPPGALETLQGAAPRSVDGLLAEALTLSGAAALGYADPSLGTEKAAESRRLALRSGDTGSLVVAAWAQAAAAHARGELADSVLQDLRETHDLPHLAVRLFDGQLCVTQRFLYGARPYDDVIAFADHLAAEAERLEAGRGHAFAITLRGEARLLSGDLEAADADLAEGERLHRGIGGATGEAHALQRRAEVAIRVGDPDVARALLDRSLDVARISDVGFHLLDRIYGTKIAVARDLTAALEEAEDAVRGPLETCPGCRITFAYPAAVASVEAGDLDRARAYERSVAWLANVVMRLPAWHAAHTEVRGRIAGAEGDAAVAVELLREAARRFEDAGQPWDAARCTALATG